VGDVDVPGAFRVLHADGRWSGSPAGMAAYAYPGCGFGGYCLPKDTAALAAKAEERGHRSTLLREVLEINRRVAAFHADRIASALEPTAKITVLGLAFKPGSDDVRATPSAEIIRLLLERGLTDITAHDPLANERFERAYGLDIRYAKTIEEAVADADAVVIATAWPEFGDHAAALRGKAVFDLRYTGAFDAEASEVIQP
jgi:UDPglucose 6-dehydrogenase